MNDLKLIALDGEDLAILSAHLQDAVLKVGEMTYLKRERRFAAVVNRFDWPAAQSVAQSGTKSGTKPARKVRARKQRRRTALRLERVTGARLQGVDPKAKDRVLVLLAMQFEPAEAPAGTVTLYFAGGGAIRLEVECIEAEMRDLGAVWATRSEPDHGQPGTGNPGPGNPRNGNHET